MDLGLELLPGVNGPREMGAGRVLRLSPVAGVNRHESKRNETRPLGPSGLRGYVFSGGGMQRR